MDLRVCRKCTEPKDEGEYYAYPRRSDGLDYYCKLCRSKLAVKNRYGISSDQKQGMLEAQGNRCASCGSENPQSDRGWNLDHDHETGEVRGVICKPCNLVLGFVEDSTEHLERLIEYLQTRKSLVAERTGFEPAFPCERNLVFQTVELPLLNPSATK